MSELTDTHCHIHAAFAGRKDFTAEKWHSANENDPEELKIQAEKAGVTRLICVGTELNDSVDAYNFAKKEQNVWASLGIHPHDAGEYSPSDLETFQNLIREDQKKKIVAIGECGLDYHYENSSKHKQKKMLELQLDMAQKYDLPVIFHVRDAYDDFWPIFANFKGLRGVLHSFTEDLTVLDKALSKDLYIGLNGIMTFTQDQHQLDMATKVPLNRLLLETDAPYLTPKPFRGKICKPEHIALTVQFLADLRGEDAKDLASQTTKNACKIFDIN